MTTLTCPHCGTLAHEAREVDKMVYYCEKCSKVVGYESVEEQRRPPVVDAGEDELRFRLGAYGKTCPDCSD